MHTLPKQCKSVIYNERIKYGKKTLHKDIVTNVIQENARNNEDGEHETSRNNM